MPVVRALSVYYYHKLLINPWEKKRSWFATPSCSLSVSSQRAVDSRLNTIVHFNNFSASWWSKINMHSVETILQTLNLDLFLSWRYAVWYSHDAGQQHWATVPSQPRDHEGEPPIPCYAYNHSVPIQPLCFLLSVRYSINYIRYWTLTDKIGFVFHDVAQLQANVTVLSMFKVGWLSYDVR